MWVKREGSVLIWKSILLGDLGWFRTRPQHRPLPWPLLIPSAQASRAFDALPELCEAIFKKRYRTWLEGC